MKSHPFHLFSWRHVRAALDNIYRCNSYYLGGTLCIDMAQGYSVLLNRNGRGNALVVGGKSIRFLMPKDVEESVNRIYKEVKECTI